MSGDTARWEFEESGLAAWAAALAGPPSAHSPLNRLAGSGGAPPAIDDPDRFTTALGLLARPTRLLTQRWGGPLRAFGQAWSVPSAGGGAVATLEAGADGRVAIALHADMSDFVDDWLGLHALEVEGDVPNALPPPLPAGALPLLLHAIDCWRRASYLGALRHAIGEPPAITASEFARTLKAAAASGDLRWLLPAFLQLTPGLDHRSLEASEEHLGLLAELDLLGIATPGADPLLGFAETGAWIGAEFMLGWQHAVGVRLESFDGAAGVASQAFLAPTPLANHWFEPLPYGDWNHQPLDSPALTTQFLRFLAVDGAPAEATACHQCGAPLRPGARFCPACGTAVTLSG